MPVAASALSFRAWYFGRKSFLVNMGFEVLCQYLVPSGLRMSFCVSKLEV